MTEKVRKRIQKITARAQARGHVMDGIWTETPVPGQYVGYCAHCRRSAFVQEGVDDLSGDVLHRKCKRENPETLH